MFGIFMFVKFWKMSDVQYVLPGKRLFAGQTFDHGSKFVGIYMECTFRMYSSNKSKKITLSVRKYKIF